MSIGALICFLGGLMAVDIASKRASGAALGVVGIASYIGAALQDLISGITILSGKVLEKGSAAVYDFSSAKWFWIASTVLSVLCTVSIWNVTGRPKQNR